ncbi:hypothetical protein [Neolewinella sp.]|uniref:hypothetical protein n=1 Tax=Neolewinella sp. TaxID=2993543 RepID=UPI003B52D5EA
MLEAKKYNLIERIISVADERVIDAIASIKDRADDVRAGVPKKSSKYTTSTYQELQSRFVDIEGLKVQQNYTPTTPAELTSIAEEANIEQSIEELLAGLKRMG